MEKCRDAGYVKVASTASTTSISGSNNNNNEESASIWILIGAQEVADTTGMFLAKVLL